MIASSTATTGDSDKQLVLSEARAFVVRKYLVEHFALDDTRLKTLGSGKNTAGSQDGEIAILVYADAPAAVPKVPAKR